MSSHEFAIVERLPGCRIAVFPTEYPAKDVTNEIEIGPLFPLFFASMKRTYEKETGKTATDEAAMLWMGPARFHLPPTMRWICRLGPENSSPSGRTAEMWMAVSDRVVLGEYANVKKWNGGLFASVESYFNTPVTETWKGLQRLLTHHGLKAIGKEVLVENFQAINHGGWDRYRVMVEIDEPEILKHK